MNIGGKRGGDAKIVGNVVQPPPDQSDSRGNDALVDSDWWNEIAIVHYPSIKHFCDMAAGKDYQAINDEYRLPVSNGNQWRGVTRSSANLFRRWQIHFSSVLPRLILAA